MISMVLDVSQSGRSSCQDWQHGRYDPTMCMHALRSACLLARCPDSSSSLVLLYGDHVLSSLYACMVDRFKEQAGQREECG